MVQISHLSLFFSAGFKFKFCLRRHLYMTSSSLGPYLYSFCYQVVKQLLFLQIGKYSGLHGCLLLDFFQKEWIQYDKIKVKLDLDALI